ncbi:hypothetical protein SASPL_122379 [Salvia splendens]|uniref:Uncharacterized protein n=1 Tax=Salvia splendens TaxID=180675 RepID=A0A8X8XMV9_SALSN|nr:hypothetical protein SASPL_122379 [Salvia splendens]
MAKLSAYFVIFILFSLVIRPGIQARLLSKESGLQGNEFRRIISSEEVELAKSGPSPGAGHEIGQKKNAVVDVYSGPSPGVGHGFDRKDYGKRKTTTGMRSGPRPGDGNGVQNREGSLVAAIHSGPSPGEGHDHVPAKPVDENKS